ncbi:hypothetical protein DL546_000650 [Coniochaeta pulveracea]|uniref:Ubiquitin-protein ligase sel1 n=1 Tax=Coniochaeta pulveracea TaxID=177199 RepID=A0A420XYG2_9PEZI|nr:hypothetical protein DL546_000650 [Coniochaeta pulveracea]
MSGWKRDFFYDDPADDPDYVPFWYTKTGVIVKWCIFLGLLVAFSAYMILGRIHAQRRIARGLPPLAYHRWLVPRAQLASVDPRYAFPQAAYQSHQPRPQHEQGEYYGMYSMPPPVYDPNAPRLPDYYPPQPQQEQQQEGVGSKVDPNQARDGPSLRMDDVPPPAGPPPASSSRADDFAPPAGPPPSALQNQGTGASNNPYRT